MQLNTSAKEFNKKTRALEQSLFIFSHKLRQGPAPEPQRGNNAEQRNLLPSREQLLSTGVSAVTSVTTVPLGVVSLIIGLG